MSQISSIIQVLKVNEAKSGVSRKTGNPYDMQDAECVLLSEAGEILQVGVLQIPKHLRDKVRVGIFTGSFALQAGMQDRRIGAVLTDIIPIPAKPQPKAA